jgi:hypothetical protein
MAEMEVRDESIWRFWANRDGEGGVGDVPRRGEPGSSKAGTKEPPELRRRRAPAEKNGGQRRRRIQEKKREERGDWETRFLTRNALVTSDGLGGVERRRILKKTPVARGPNRRFCGRLEEFRFDSSHEDGEDNKAHPPVVEARLGVDGVIDTVKVSVRWP